MDTQEIAKKAWEYNGQVIWVDNLEEAVALANQFAPEHLEIQIQDPESMIADLKNYGSLFIGENAAEVLGDYVSGTNHTLSTMGPDRYSGGVSVHFYIKILTGQRVSDQGLDQIGPVAYRMALGEGLSAHAKVAKIRLDHKNL